MWDAAFKNHFKLFKGCIPQILLGPVFEYIVSHDKCSRILEIVEMNENIIWISRSFKKTLWDSHISRSIFLVKMFFFLADFVKQDFIRHYCLHGYRMGNLLTVNLKSTLWIVPYLKNFLSRLTIFIFKNVCDALRDLVPFVQFKKREKHPWRSVTFSKVAG